MSITNWIFRLILLFLILIWGWTYVFYRCILLIVHLFVFIQTHYYTNSILIIIINLRMTIYINVLLMHHTLRIECFSLILSCFHPLRAALLISIIRGWEHPSWFIILMMQCLHIRVIVVYYVSILLIIFIIRDKVLFIVLTSRMVVWSVLMCTSQWRYYLFSIRGLKSWTHCFTRLLPMIINQQIRRRE